MVMRVASFFSVQPPLPQRAQFHRAGRLKRAQIGFRKTDNAFLAVDDVAALQPPPTNVSPANHPPKLDYWTLILGDPVKARR